VPPIPRIDHLCPPNGASGKLRHSLN
jgi:hypothetical protein